MENHSSRYGWRMHTLLIPSGLRKSKNIWNPWCRDMSVRWTSLCHILAEHVHIVLVFHVNTTSISSRYSTCSSISALGSISNLAFGEMMWKENQGRVDWAVCPGRCQTPVAQHPPIMTRRTASSYSSISAWGSCSAATTLAVPCSRVQHFRLIVSFSLGSSKVVTSILAPSSPLHFPIHRTNDSMFPSLVQRSSIPAAPSIELPGVGLSSPLSHGLLYGFTGISDIE